MLSTHITPGYVYMHKMPFPYRSYKVRALRPVPPSACHAKGWWEVEALETVYLTDSTFKCRVRWAQKGSVSKVYCRHLEPEAPQTRLVGAEGEEK